MEAKEAGKRASAAEGKAAETQQRLKEQGRLLASALLKQKETSAGQLAALRDQVSKMRTQMERIGQPPAVARPLFQRPRPTYAGHRPTYAGSRPTYVGPRPTYSDHMRRVGYLVQGMKRGALTAPERAELSAYGRKGWVAALRRLKAG